MTLTFSSGQTERPRIIISIFSSFTQAHTHTHTLEREYSLLEKERNVTKKEREKMSDKRRVPGLQPICLGQHQRGNGQSQRNKRAIPPLKVLLSLYYAV